MCTYFKHYIFFVFCYQCMSQRCENSRQLRSQCIFFHPTTPPTMLLLAALYIPFFWLICVAACVIMCRIKQSVYTQPSGRLSTTSAFSKLGWRSSSSASHFSGPGRSAWSCQDSVGSDGKANITSGVEIPLNRFVSSARYSSPIWIFCLHFFFTFEDVFIGFPPNHSRFHF